VSNIRCSIKDTRINGQVPISRRVPFGHFMFLSTLWLSLHYCGLYYKNITIVNDASTVVSELCHNLKRHFWLPIMLPESSIKAPIKHYSTGVTHDDCNMVTVQKATG
jgi:hypothetical protein